MSTQDTTERRAYYRIQDKIALQISPPAEALQDAPLFNLLNELYLLELESQPLLRSISEQQRTLLNYLKITNKRIDLLANALAHSLLKSFGEPQPVSLSEDSISLVSPQRYALGHCLSIRLILLPQAFALQLDGRVVRCLQQDDGSYQLALQFNELADAQRQVLARHIIQKQAQERREALADPAE
ncbi:MAG: PilZ domain-containing protein [Thiopseudomonas sp.]|nr:PilZ domain-containing protein [Thiopseudomonas sp.]